MKMEMHIVPEHDPAHRHMASSRCKCGMEVREVNEIKIFTHRLVGEAPDQWRIKPAIKK